MKRILLLFSMASVLFVFCSGSKEKEKFIDTYKDIMVARGRFLDTLKANEEVLKVMKNHGYTQESFKQEYFKYANNREEFLQMIDTARARAERELIQKYKVKFTD